MGCNSSQPADDSAAKAAEKQRQRDAANAAMNAPKLDPKDFMLQKLQGQTIVKEPGSDKGRWRRGRMRRGRDVWWLQRAAPASVN